MLLLETQNFAELRRSFTIDHAATEEVYMEFWEFLIQKDGDRSWLPVEAPGAEILEGRYRIVARSHRANTSTEIRITHLSPDEDPPKRRVQSRQSQTNPDGLLVVMPYTRLQPGVWELRCTGDLMADLMGESWHHTVQLQVLPHEPEPAADWEGDDEAVEAPAELSRPEVAPAILRLIKNGSARKTEPAAIAPPPASTAIPEPVAEVEPIVARSAPEPVIEVEPPAIAVEIPPPPAAVATEAIASDTLPPVAMFEERTAAAALPEFELPEFEESAADETAIASTAVFSPLLEDSSTTPMDMAEVLSQQVVDEVFQVLELSQDSPAPLQSKFVEAAHSGQVPLWLFLPQESYTARRGEPLHLVGRIETDAGLAPGSVPQAELCLYLRDPQSAHVLVEARQLLILQQFPHEFAITATLPRTLQSRLFVGELHLLNSALPEPELLATYSFTVTMDVSDLLEAIANNTAEIYPPLEVVEQRGDLDLSFVQFLNSPKPTLTFKPTTSFVLPPQLHTAKSVSSSKGLDLPSFQEKSRLQEAEPVRLEEPAAHPENGMVDDLMQPLPVERAGQPEPEASQREVPAPEQPASVVPPAPPEPADAPLEWTEALLDDSDPMPDPMSHPVSEDVEFHSLNLKHRFWSRLSSLAGDRELTTALKQEVTVQGLDTATAASQEVVLPDEPPAPARWGTSGFQDVRKSLLKAPETIPADQPIPMPRLEVPNRELTSGDRITISVKIPRTASSLYVKLWLFDPQNRVVLDGPRWLMDLPANGLGDLETWIQLEVPHGCLEMQVEAIAIEIATQRESHKASVSRAVMPPDVPALSLEELDV